MVQVTFDTNNDSLQELEEALKILQAAVERRGGAIAPVAHAAQLDIAEPATEVAENAAEEGPAAPAKEAIIDAPFIKITVKNDEHKADEHKGGHADGAVKKDSAQKPGIKVPTLNQLLHDESLTEEELAKMFGEQGTDAVKSKPKEHKTAPEESAEIKDEKEDAYIEIIEYTDEKK
jgi:chromosome segregation and condensation protein ScpB